MDVILAAPKGSGTSVRRLFCRGKGINASYAVFQDATGNAKTRAIALGIGVGAGYLFETDFKKKCTRFDWRTRLFNGRYRWNFEAQIWSASRERPHTFRSFQWNGRRAYSKFNAARGWEWNGLDVRQLFNHCATRCVRLEKEIPHSYSACIPGIIRKRCQRCRSQSARSIRAANPTIAKLAEELKELRNSELWQAGAAVRSLETGEGNCWSVYDKLIVVGCSLLVVGSKAPE